MDDKSKKTKWAVIKTGSGRITGYIEMFRTGDNKWVTIPGASRFSDSQPEDFVATPATAIATATEADPR